MAVPIKSSRSHVPMMPRNIGRTLQWVALDILVVVAAYSAALSARAVTASLDYREGLKFILFAAIVIPIMLYLFGVYHRIWSMTSGHGVTVIINAMGAATLILLLVDILQEQRPMPVSVLLIGNTLALGGFVAVRYRSRLIRGMSWRWRAIWYSEFPRSMQVTRVLIIGAGESGQGLALQLKHRFPKGDHIYDVVGFIDDDPSKQGMFVEGCRVLGTREDIPQVAEKYLIDLIVISIHRLPGSEFREVLAYCERTKTRIKLIPDMFAFMNAKQGNLLLRDVQPQDLIGRSTITRHEDIDLSLVTSKVTLVTGAAGSIGSELCRQLCNFQAQTLILLDNNESALHELFVELSAKFPEVELVPILADITLKDRLWPLFANHHPQIIFHAAAYKHVPMLERYPNEALRVNIGGTRNLTLLAQEFGVERFVLISTDKAVNPTCIMGASKRICELMMRALSEQGHSQTLFTSVRFGNVLGSRGSVLPTFNYQIDSGGPVTITHPEMTRYFMSIPEAANLVIHAACLTRGNDIFLLRMGEVVRIVDLAERMIRLRGLRPYVDVEIKFTGVRPGEKLFEELHGESEEVLDTVHPHIMQLKDRNGSFDAAAFLERIDVLLRADFEDNTDMLTRLAQLEHIVNPDYAAAPGALVSAAAGD